MSEAQNHNPALGAMLFEVNKKSVGVAYLLWFFFGALGGHRFYARKTGTAATMLVLFLVGLITSVAGIGLILLGIVGLWALIDAFLIPDLIRQHNTKLAVKYSGQGLSAA